MASSNGTSIISGECYSIGWNGSKWVAAGFGINVLAYSSDGITWNASTNGNVVFGSDTIPAYCATVAWNGSIWVAGGKNRSNKGFIAYSLDGETWMASSNGEVILTTQCNSVGWNGSLWVAGGSGTNILATSSDSMIWTASPSGNTVFAGGSCRSVASRRVLPYVGLNVAGGGGGGGGAGATGAQGATGATGTFSFTGPTGSVLHYSGASVTGNTGFTYTPDSGLTIQGNIIPSADNQYKLGSSTNRFKEIWVYDIHTAPFTIYIGGAEISSNGTSISLPLGSQIGGVNPGTIVIKGKFDTTSELPTTAIVGDGYIIQSHLWVAIEVNPSTIAGWVDVGIIQGPKGDTGTSGVGTTLTENFTVAGGQGTNTIAYTFDGKEWLASINGSTVFTSKCYSVAWNGSIWVAGGEGTNTLAYSSDGIRWAGSSSGTSIIDSKCMAVAWNGSVWVAGGEGTNTIAYSSDGITWTQSANGSAMMSSCNSVAWNGSLWVIGGTVTNSLIYSSDGITWTPSVNGNTYLSDCRSVAWNGSRWVACGNGTDCLIFSSDGINWIPSDNGNDIFTTICFSVAWNGYMWVAGGRGANVLANSFDGINWNESDNGNSIFTTVSGDSGITAICTTVAWNGSMWIAGGGGENYLAHSFDGINWIASTSGNNIFTLLIYGVASRRVLPYVGLNVFGGSNNSGVEGVEGTTGGTGATGTEGTTGDTGDTGDTGAAGSAGATGATGATGSAGVTGATGSAGQEAISLDEAPTNSVGLLGQFYYDTVAKGFYGPKQYYTPQGINIQANPPTGWSFFITDDDDGSDTGIYPVANGQAYPSETQYLKVVYTGSASIDGTLKVTMSSSSNEITNFGQTSTTGYLNLSDNSGGAGNISVTFNGGIEYTILSIVYVAVEDNAWPLIAGPSYPYPGDTGYFVGGVTTLGDAFNRIAALLSTLNSGNIPTI